MHSTHRAVARVAPLILDAYDPLLLLRQASAAVRSLRAGTRLSLLALGSSQDAEAVVVDMEARQRGCPPALRPLAVARRTWYRATMGSAYVPDVQHYLVLEAPDAAHLAQLRDDLTASLALDLTWLEGDRMSVVDPPAQGTEHPGHIMTAAGRAVAARSITRLPARVRVGWLRPLLGLRFPYRLAVTIEGRDQWKEQSRLTDRLEQMALITAAHRDVRMDRAQVELDALTAGLSTATTTIVRLGLSVTTWADSPDALATQTEDIEAALRAMGCGVRVGIGDQGRLVAGDAPLYRTTDTVAAAAYPWQRPAPGHTTGLIVGEAGGALVRYDQAKGMTGLIAIVGVQGAGKSILGQFMALQTLLEGYGITVIDSSGSWRALVEAAGGPVLACRDRPALTAEVVRAPAVLLDTSGLESGQEAAAYDLCKRVTMERVGAWQGHGGQCRVYVDEGWGLIKSAGSWVQEIGRKARHADMHLTLLTQNLSDALDDPDGVKFFTAIPCTFLMHTVDERIGQGAGLGWIDRVYGHGTAEVIAGLRRFSDYSECFFVERDPTRTVLQKAKINIRVTPYDLKLFSSYRHEREERAAATKEYGSIIDGVIARVDAGPSARPQ